MDFALDKDGNRVYAEDGIYNDCVCPACGSPVLQRRGDTNRHHFAHDPRKRNEEKCPYDYNDDYLKACEEERLTITEARRLHAQARERMEREDYMKALVEHFEDIEKSSKKKG